MTKTVAIMMVFVFVVAAIVGGGVAYWLKPSAEVHGYVTVEEIRKIAQLATVEYTLTGFYKEIFYSSIVIKKVPTDYVFSYCKGKITGSVDLDKATIDVQKGGDAPHVSIHFKRGSILVSDIALTQTPDKDKPGQFKPNPDTVSVRDELKGALFYQGANADQRQYVQNVALQKMKQGALDTDIVEKTKENAKTILGGFVGLLGYGATITFDPDADEPSPPEK